jgi:hypothetical protein
MKFVEKRSFAGSEAAARKLLELANAFEPPSRQDLYRENQRPVPVRLEATPAEYKAGLDYAITKDWLELHEGGTFLRFTEAGAALFARRQVPRCGCGKRERGEIATPLSLAAVLCAIITRIKTTRTSYRSKGLTSSTSL